MAIATTVVAAHATVPADLCTGNPCVVTADATLDPTDSLDFGSGTELRIAAGVTVTVGAGATSPAVVVSAGTVILEPGSGIVGREGSLTIEASAGNLELQRSGSGIATIRFRNLADTPPSGPRADLILAAQGDVVLDGVISGKIADPLAGVDLVDVSAAGSVLGAGRIDVRSPRLNELSIRPTVQFYAAGPIAFSGRILASGGCQGGEIIVRSESGPTALGFMDVSARGCPATGGLGTAGSVLVAGAGEGSLLDGIDARSRGTGGDVRLSADELHVSGTIDARGVRGDGGTVRIDGGDCVMEADGDIRVASRNGSGQVEIIASNAVSAGDVVLASIHDAGIVTVTASGTITVGRRVRTRSVSPGPIILEACGAVSIGGGAVLDTRATGAAPAGDITVRGDAVDVSGDLLALGGSVALQYYTSAPVVTGTILPAPTITQVAPPASCGP
jgi:hypothetical protein